MTKRLDDELVERWLAGQCTAEDDARIRALAAEDHRLRSVFRALRDEWSIPRYDVDEAWGNLATAIREGSSPPDLPRNSSRGSISRFAVVSAFLAAACVSLVLGPRVWLGWAPASGSWTEVAAPYGEQARVILSDGSQVLLDAGSRLKYRQSLLRNRDVILDGQAYFEVKGRAYRPLRVRAGHGLITVLGTKFSVRAFESDSVVQIAVREGLVAVTDTATVSGSRTWAGRHSRSGGQHAGAGEIALLQSGSSVVTVLESGAGDSFAWIENIYVFRDTRMEDLAHELARLYDVVFVVDSSIATRRLTGRFHRQPLPQLMSSISMTTDIEFRIEGDTVFLEPQRRPAAR